MLATLAEYERELIVERVNAGIARAKGRTAKEAAQLVGWSRATLHRHQQAQAARENTAT